MAFEDNVHCGQSTEVYSLIGFHADTNCGAVTGNRIPASGVSSLDTVNPPLRTIRRMNLDNGKLMESDLIKSAFVQAQLNGTT
jgi:hypothetical protein